MDRRLIPDDFSGAPPWEIKPRGEADAIRTLVGAVESRVRATAAGGPARRDAHPKAHGCVEAEFRVLEGLSSALRVGLFARPRAYGAWIRFSNGSASAQNDSVGDGRGMALKVLGVDGSRSGTQDLIMINSPAFFVRNAVDYVDFELASNPLLFFFPGFNPFRFRLREMWVARGITGRKVSNPLNTPYWSVTPYLFGDAACKFSARPVAPLSPFEDRAAPNFLHDNLALALAEGDAAFDLYIQLCARPERMPIEDAAIAWSESDSPFLPVARITIPRQGFDSPERIALGENLSFTPWHGLDAHRPLGGINRVRRSVYEAVSRLRHEINGVPRVEPESLPPLSPP